MASTGLLVSAHTSQLANAQFLPPGAAVLELIQRNWFSPLDRSFKVQSNAIGDIHHYAWRCRHANCTSYIDQDVGRLYGHFTAEECSASKTCMDKHTNVDIHVDCSAVASILRSRLPLLWSNSPPSVEEAELPWPPSFGQ
mmetsp:Transcript_1977/g.4896  ORF Transcript_1977/g.4896 Transcript_1977/m.4896 type:complete len:140 (+) Transcript_1977:1246-1665(+)